MVLVKLREATALNPWLKLSRIKTRRIRKGLMTVKDKLVCIVYFIQATCFDQIWSSSGQ